MSTFLTKIAQLKEEGLIDPRKSAEEIIKDAGLKEVMLGIFKSKRTPTPAPVPGTSGTAAGKVYDAVTAPYKWLSTPLETTKKKVIFDTAGRVEKQEVVRESVAGNVPQILRKAVLLAGGIGGGLAAGEAITSVPGLMRRKNSLKTILDSTEIPKGEKKQARKIFEILDTYAPSLAENPLIAKSFVEGVLQYGGTIDHKTVSELINAERGMLDTSPGIVDRVHSGVKAVDAASGLGV